MSLGGLIGLGFFCHLYSSPKVFFLIFYNSSSPKVIEAVERNMYTIVPV